MFNIYAMDKVFGSKVKPIQYADDIYLYIYKSKHSFEDCVSALRSNVQEKLSWFQDNKFMETLYRS